MANPRRPRADPPLPWQRGLRAAEEPAPVRPPRTGYFFSDDPEVVPSTHALVAVSRIALRESLPEHQTEERRQLMLGMGRVSRADEAMQVLGRRLDATTEEETAVATAPRWPPLTSEDFAAARALVREGSADSSGRAPASGLSTPRPVNEPSENPAGEESHILDEPEGPPTAAHTASERMGGCVPSGGSVQTAEPDHAALPPPLSGGVQGSGTAPPALGSLCSGMLAEWPCSRKFVKGRRRPPHSGREGLTKGEVPLEYPPILLPPMAKCGVPGMAQGRLRLHP